MKELDYNKVLLVDDEPDLLELVEDEMIELGFETKTASNGKEALEVLESYPAFLVFSNINMPKMTGVELLEHIQQMREAKPYVILCTGFGGYERDMIKQKGALELVSKPFDFKKLEELIKMIKPGRAA